jgi:predicted TIM-barrel fold metal-dependent hydrolase
MLPALMKERLGELGFDFAIIYPSLGLPLSNIANDQLRQAAARAYNTMTAEIYKPFRDVFAPVATIPTYTPQEAIAELEHAVGLGFKVIMIRGALPRPLPAAGRDFGVTFETTGTREVPYYVDAIGLDSPYDYDPFFQRCVDLHIAVTGHGGAHEWADRKSVNNNVFNHIGHFAQANHVMCKGVFLGGLPKKFPSLNFAFLEGGVGYGVNLLWDLVGHWEKVTPSAMLEHLNPAKTDFGKLKELVVKYGDPRTKALAEEIVDALPKKAVEPVDDFWGISSKRELVDMFTRNFYFGCEADDPVTAWAFDKRMGAKLKAVFSSDISHFDVPVMADVLPEAYEMVEKGWLNEEDFREFMFSNAVELHGKMNPDFFKGTTVEREAAAVLEGAKLAVAG